VRITADAPTSARADNVCKRILDDVALRLKNEPGSRLALIGYADPSESGVAESRLETRAAGGQAGAGPKNRRVDIVWVPAGTGY
jgi:outer membrane protein OmpA-like peptidoglycan-associated protein